MSPLLNYTTSIAAHKSVSEIHGLLVKARARSILTDYSPSGAPLAVSFEVETPIGPRRFRLPIDAVRVHKVLRSDRVSPRYQTPEQAERVAWRIVKDWLEAQLAIIATEIVTLDCVMLPYMQDDSGRSVYELYVDRQLPQLEAGA